MWLWQLLSAHLLSKVVQPPPTSTCPPELCCGHGTWDSHSNSCQCQGEWHGPTCGINRTLWETGSRSSALFEQAREKRDLAQKSRRLIELMSNTTGNNTAAATTTPQEVAVHLQELAFDVHALLAAADDLERQAALAASAEPVNFSLDMRSDQCSCSTAGDARPSTASPKQTGAMVQLSQPDGGRAASVVRLAERSKSGLGRRTETSRARASDAALRDLGDGLRFSSMSRAPPSALGFGFEHVNLIASHDQDAPECDSCNFPHVCVEGDCYCEPGMTGETCQEPLSSHRNEGTIPLLILLIILAVVFVLGFIATWIRLALLSQQKDNKETELGFEF